MCPDYSKMLPTYFLVRKLLTYFIVAGTKPYLPYDIINEKI